jgi:outer membrane lipoprotein SlyB
MKTIFLLLAMGALVLTGCQKSASSSDNSYGSSTTNNYSSTNTP